MNEKWDQRFLELSNAIALWSKDFSSKCGAVIVRDKRILSTGYNGAAAGIDDTWVLETRERKNKFALHAEANAILNAAKEGISLSGSTLYCTHAPCENCAKMIIQSGINTVICKKTDDNFKERWNNETSLELFVASKITVREI